MVPVYKKLGRHDVQNIAANRSIKTKAGEYGTRFGFGGDDYIKNQTEGLIDPEVVVLQFIGMDEKPIVTIFNYTCHSTSIKWGKIISPDFSGYACDLIEEKTDAPAFFLQGACGNVGTGKYADGSIDVAKKMGAELASSVLNALKTATVCSKNALEVYTWEEDIVLSDHLPSLDEAYSELDRLAKSKVSISSLWKAAAMIEVLENRKELVKSRLFLIKSGMWCVAGLPAESFVESALAIKGASQYKYTMVSAYYDCTLWYIPTWRAYDKGGFEVQGGWSYTSEGTSETLSRSVIQKL